MPGPAVVSLLGTGDYKAVSHELGGIRSAVECSFSAVALSRFAKDSSVVILGTRAAFDRHGASLRGSLGRPYKAMEIPEPYDAEGQKAVFTACYDAIMAVPGEVWVDVTHGYRAQPLIGVAAAAFAANERRRSGDSPGRVRLLYASLQPDAKVARFWDLAFFLDAIAWDAALDTTARFGRAEELASLIEAESRAAVAARCEEAKEVSFKDLARTLRDFSESLSSVRAAAVVAGQPRKPEGKGKTRDSSGLARILAERIGTLGPRLFGRIGPLEKSLERTRKLAASLSAESLVSKQGVAAQLNLCGLYLDSGRDAEAAALLRETLVTAYALACGDASFREPGQAFDPARSHDVESRLHREALRNTLVGKIWSDMRNIRNDVEHAGYNRDPREAAAIREGLKDCLARAREMSTSFAPLGAPVGPFVNCTNHSCGDWFEPQIAAARAIAEPLVDYKFPAVSAAGSSSEVAAIARRTVAEILALDPRAVAVQGDFLLTFQIILGLTAAGVPCYCAASERDASVTTGHDEVVKSSRFRFAGWRRYDAAGA